MKLQNTVSTRRQCAWPIGEPRTKDFRFCGKPVVPGRPYCQEHVEQSMTVVTRRIMAKSRKVNV